MGINGSESLAWIISGKTRWLAVLTGCFTAVAASVSITWLLAFVPILLILGAIGQPRFPRSGAALISKCFVPEFMSGSHHCRTAHSKHQDVANPSRFRHCGSNLTLCCVVLACHLLRRSADNRLPEIDAPPGWYAIAWLLGRWFCGSDCLRSIHRTEMPAVRSGRRNKDDIAAPATKSYFQRIQPARSRRRSRPRPAAATS